MRGFEVNANNVGGTHTGDEHHNSKMSPTNTRGISPVAEHFLENKDKGPEPLLFGAKQLNNGVEALKIKINNGQRSKLGKVSAYLGYRLITYSLVPAIASAVSLVAFGALAAVSNCFGCKRFNEGTRASFGYLCQNLFDITSDARQALRICRIFSEESSLSRI